MDLKYKTIFSNSTLRGLLLSVCRVVCVVAMAYYMGQAIVSGVNTLGAIIYNLFPVLAFGGILLLLEIQKGSFASLFSMPALSDIKVVKKGLILVAVGLFASVLFLYSGINSPIDLIMILLVILAVGFSVILMLRGQSIEALCVFILTWPFIIFENGHKRAFFHLTNSFSDTLKFDVGDAASFIYICLLLTCWLLGFLVNPRRLVPTSRSLGVWLFVGAGLLSTIFSLQPATSMVQFILAILLPVLLFVFFVNEVRSLIDLKKLSLALGFTMTIITIIWFYYAVYRHAETDLTISKIASMRGGGGRFLGSRTIGFGGFSYENISPLIIPCILALSATANNIMTKRLWMVIVILMMTATFFTFGRVAWVATFLCFLPWIWRNWRSCLLSSLLLVCCFYFREFFSNVFSRFSVLSSLQGIQ